MTREEAKKLFSNDDTFEKSKIIMSKIDQIFDEFNIELFKNDISSFLNPKKNMNKIDQIFNEFKINFKK